MKADKFIVTHLQSIESNTKLFKSTELRNKSLQLELEVEKLSKSPKSIYIPDPTHISELEVMHVPEISYISDLNYTSDSPHSPISFHNTSSENEDDPLTSDDSMNYQENWKGKN